jgi:hypothetical protein
MSRTFLLAGVDTTVTLSYDTYMSNTEQGEQNMKTIANIAALLAYTVGILAVVVIACGWIVGVVHAGW